ncbi:MAG: group II intron reverse transcriptase/maturase [Candidatus Marithrix sp.]
MKKIFSITECFPKLNRKQQLKEAWKTVDWKACQNFVDRLQRSISVAMEYENYTKVRELRRILFKSEAMTLLSIRRVTQDNKGKRTAGVDGIKSLTPAQRMELVENLKDGIERPWSPVRQVEILKKNGKIRTLGIPTINDRVYQAKLKAIIEPSYETIAERDSYGFRPKRSTKDAIEQIFMSTNRKQQAWILEGDLKGFFDNISTVAITDNIIIKNDKQLIGTIENLVKSGAMTVNHEMVDTDKGTPQGGIISPLLANIAFTGMETMVLHGIRTGQKSRRKDLCQIQVIVYADDFVVIAKERWIVEELKVVIGKWCMEKMNVELSSEKTRITDIYDGFDFLGCNIRRYKTSNTTSKLLIKPSKDSIKSIKLKIKDVIKSHGGVTQDVLIGKLNPVIRGYANYHSGNVAKKVFSAIGRYIFKKLWRWAYKKHNNKGKVWIAKKYWHSVGKGNWVFKTKDYELYDIASTKIVRHIKIKGSHHIFDGQVEYWNKRSLANMNGKMTRKQSCLKKQKFACNICSQEFKHDSIIELDHIIPKSRGGNEELNNLQVLHRHCHDTKTASDGSYSQKRRV